MGIPVLATPLSCDGIRVRHGESAWLAEVDGFADAIVQLLGDAPRRRGLAEKGRALIEAEYSRTQTADRYERLYEEVLRGRLK